MTARIHDCMSFDIKKAYDEFSGLTTLPRLVLYVCHTMKKSKSKPKHKKVAPRTTRNAMAFRFTASEEKQLRARAKKLKGRKTVSRVVRIALGFEKD